MKRIYLIVQEADEKISRLRSFFEDRMNELEENVMLLKTQLREMHNGKNTI